MERFCRWQTDGFRLEKTLTDFPYQSKWEVENPLLTKDVFKQSFTFLGSGAQVYAFLGEDGETVLKIFKHYHFGLKSTAFKQLPLPSFLDSWKTKVLEKRKKRIESIFASTLIASQEIPEQTGIFYAKINETQDTYPTVTLYDKIHIAHKLNLNKAPFILQKKADLLLPYLQKHPEKIKTLTDSLSACMKNRADKQITNTDPRIYRNFGVLQDQIIEIDIGSFTHEKIEDAPQNPVIALKEWLSKNPSQNLQLEPL